MNDIEIMDFVELIFKKEITKNIYLKIPITYDISRIFLNFGNMFKIHSIGNWSLMVHIYKF